jgi:RecG-like helicase
MQYVRSALVHFDEILPESIKKKHGFLGRRQSLDHLHFPKSRSDFEAAQSEL